MLQEETVNIGPRERRVRLTMGVLLFIATVFLAIWILQTNPSAVWALLLFVLTYQTVRFYYDYRTGTCPLKAELGQRKMEGFMTTTGDPIPDHNLTRRIRSKSRRALVISLAVALVVTFGVLLLG